jgi:hypothetical protein
MMTTHVPTCDVLVRNGDCTCPKVDGRRGRYLATARSLYRNPRLNSDEFLEAIADLIAAARQEGAERGWDEGEAAGWSRAMRRMSDEPSVTRATNPYRQANGATA